MRIFLIWTFRAFLFIIAVELATMIKVGIKNTHIRDGLLFLVIGSIALGAFFYFIEAKLIPKRKVTLRKKISRLFGAHTVTETITHFKLGMFDVYTELEYNLMISQHHSHELILFHIPRDQISYLVSNRQIKLREGECNSVLTYVVYQTNSWGLKRAKKKIEKILN